MGENPVHEAVGAAVDAFKVAIGEAGGTTRAVLVLAAVQDVYPTGVVAGEGFEDTHDVLAFMMAHAVGVARDAGLDLRVFDVAVGGDE